uniref:hypothetical protein n=1 Tax=Pararhizobium sp. IMCC3301 TaxID=3067904 RepID=UPI0027413C2E|nr:hypothetical protein [Pararhizobium sp. IMCC3301]
MTNTTSPPDMPDVPDMPDFHNPEVVTALVRNRNPYLARRLHELSEVWLQRLRLPFGQNAHLTRIGAN